MSGVKDWSTTTPFWSTTRYVGKALYDSGCSKLSELTKALFKAPGKETWSELGRWETLLAARMGAANFGVFVIEVVALLRGRLRRTRDFMAAWCGRARLVRVILEGKMKRREQ